MTKEELTQIRARVDAATRGRRAERELGNVKSFYANAGTDVLALLDEVERLRVQTWGLEHEIARLSWERDRAEAYVEGLEDDIRGLRLRGSSK